MVKYTNEAYLRAEDMLRGGEYQSMELEIADVVTECPLMRKNATFNGIGLAFKGASKVLGLGITNESLVKVVTGESNPKEWIGKKVTLEVREVRAATGGTTPAIRIIPKDGTKMRANLSKQLGKRYED